LPMSAGCAMWMNGGETILDAGETKTQRVLVLRPGEDAGGRQVRPGIAWEAA
jgi:hypothetical protein